MLTLEDVWRKSNEVMNQIEIAHCDRIDNVFPTAGAASCWKAWNGPFGIATFDNLIYVTYAKQNDENHDDVAGPGNGFVDVFDAQGDLMTRLISRGPLNSPWGLAEVPHKFGQFGPNVLLVGNFGDGTINAFNIQTGASLGALPNHRGDPLAFNGLWALFFFDDWLYITAGIGDESHGLFGFIRKAGEQEGDSDGHD